MSRPRGPAADVGWGGGWGYVRAGLDWQTANHMVQPAGRCLCNQQRHACKASIAGGKASMRPQCTHQLDTGHGAAQ